MEHLHGRLAQLRDDVAQVSLQRDQAQMQVKLLQAELDTWQMLTAFPEDGSLSVPARMLGSIQWCLVHVRSIIV